MNTFKADILDPESENAAVRLALAKTHVIQETKTFLEQLDHGVDLSSLDTEPGQRRLPRSDRIILVKNIPMEPPPRTCARYSSRTASSAMGLCRPRDGQVHRRRIRNWPVRSWHTLGACVATSDVAICRDSSSSSLLPTIWCSGGYAP